MSTERSDFVKEPLALTVIFYLFKGQLLFGMKIIPCDYQGILWYLPDLYNLFFRVLICSVERKGVSADPQMACP